MSIPKNRAVFLDRDGVVLWTPVRKGRPYAITENEPMRILGGVKDACAHLKNHGFKLVLVTNQPDVGHGRTSRRFVDETNAVLARALALDAIGVCCHIDADRCACRKPKPGLILGAAEELSLDLASSIVVGDRWRDIEAGQRAGCRTLFIDYGYDERRPVAPDCVALSLPAAIPWLCAPSPS